MYRARMSNLPFFAVIILAAAALTWALVAGIKGWRDPGGKFIAIGAGLLLLLLIAFVSLVLLIVVSGWAGHPF